MKRSFLAFFPLALWAAVVLTVGGLNVGGPEFLPAGADKVAHFLMYGVGGGLAAWAGRKQGHAAAAWLGLGVVLVTGLADEIHQIPLADRNADIMDWAADAVGALVVFLVVDRLLKKD